MGWELGKWAEVSWGSRLLLAGVPWMGTFIICSMELFYFPVFVTTCRNVIFEFLFLFLPSFLCSRLALFFLIVHAN